LTLIKFKRPQHKDPELELVARLLDRAESEGTVNSEIPEGKSIVGMHEGFMVTFMEDDKGHEGLAYREHKGKDFNLKTGICKTRDEAGYRLFKLIRIFNSQNIGL
jgi:hypothetical protein